jgi:hypothetical protein
MCTNGKRGGGGMPNVYKFNYTQSNAVGYSSSMDAGGGGGGSSSSYPTLRTCSR